MIERIIEEDFGRIIWHDVPRVVLPGISIFESEVIPTSNTSSKKENRIVVHNIVVDTDLVNMSPVV